MSKIRDHINDIRHMLDSGVINTGSIKSKLDDLDTELNEMENELQDISNELETQQAAVTHIKDKMY